MYSRLTRGPLGLLFVFLTIAIAGCASSGPVYAPAGNRLLTQYEQRTALAQKNLPQIVKAAEAVADHIVAKPDSLIDVPYSIQQTFAEEVLNRAGGLANTLPSVERPQLITDHDVVLFGVSSWEEDANRIVPEMQNVKKKGHLVVLFASKAGMPDDVAGMTDYFIENYAATGGQEFGEINSLINIFNYWVWQSEYAAALTRHGKYPGVLQSIMVDGADEHNGNLQPRGKRTFLGDTEARIPANTLAKAYFKRHAQLLKDLEADRTQADISRAADVVVSYLNAGKQVGVASCTHVLLSDIFRYNRTPIKPINIVHRLGAIKESLKPGDLLIFVSYIGVSTPYEDYYGAIKEADVRLISSHVHDTVNASNNASESLVHIPQHWDRPDAEVTVPFPPGYMSPVSGLNQGLIYRMLEAEVADRLAAAPTAAE